MRRKVMVIQAILVSSSGAFLQCPAHEDVQRSFSADIFECPSPYIIVMTIAIRGGCIRWTLKALSGRVRLGRVLMRAEDPVILRPGGDVRAALLEV